MEIIIYQNENGKNSVDVTLEDNNLWLSQKQMAELFGVKTPAISKHLKNIFTEGELQENMVISILETTTKHGAIQNKTQTSQIKFYNLDAIISVGYRVNSSSATQFRIWATNILKTYLIQGYAINEQKLKQQKEQIESLKGAIALVERSFENSIESNEKLLQVTKILNSFALGLELLDNYDHETLDKTGKTKNEAVKVEKEEFLSVIEQMKSEFDSDVFAVPKDDSFDSSISQIYQSFDGKDLYPSLEEKSAMHLYLITKNHSFTDGNKRIAAQCFIYFLEKNSMLFKNDVPIIDNTTLFSLTLLIAISNPSEMEIMKQIVISVLNRNQEHNGN